MSINITIYNFYTHRYGQEVYLPCTRKILGCYLKHTNENLGLTKEGEGECGQKILMCPPCLYKKQINCDSHFEF